MTHLEPADETDLLRWELADLGFAAADDPEDWAIVLRSPESFTRAEEPPALTLVNTPTPAGRLRRPRRWRSALLSVAAASTAAVVAAALLLSPTAGPSGPDERDAITAVPTVIPSATPPAAEFVSVAQVFTAAGDGAGAQVQQTAEADYWRIDSRVQFGDDPAFDRVMWLGRGRKGLLIENGERVPLPPATFSLLSKDLSWSELQSLPTEPAALRAVLVNEAETQHIRPAANLEWTVAHLVSNLLTEAPTPPAVRKALWQTLAGSSDARLLGVVSDASGRVGQGVEMHGPDKHVMTWTIDVASGELLQVDDMIEGDPSSRGRRTFLLQAPADRLPMAA